MDDNNRAFTDDEMFKAAVNDLDTYDELDNNYCVNDLTGNIAYEEIEKRCLQCGCNVNLSDDFCPICGANLTDELDSLVHVDGLQDNNNGAVRMMGQITANGLPKTSLKDRIKAKFRNNR